MEIIIGKTAGFCYGVKNAVQNSEQELKQNEKLCCLGEIVHNSKVVKQLENMGMQFINDLNENLQKNTTIIRAHGVSKKVYEQAKNENIKLIDLTCPNVLKIHKIVSEYHKKNYYTFLVGNKNHPETIGTYSFGEQDISIIENEKDIEDAVNKLKISSQKKLLIIVQTTFSLEKFLNFTQIIESKIKLNIQDIEDIKAMNTICNATKARQEETDKISKMVDYMIIVGGKNSSNTQKLYEISKRNCNNTICIEDYKEIDISEINKNNIIGIMAGASTPQSSIDKVVNLLKNT